MAKGHIAFTDTLGQDSPPLPFYSNYKKIVSHTSDIIFSSIIRESDISLHNAPFCIKQSFFKNLSSIYIYLYGEQG